MHYAAEPHRNMFSTQLKVAVLQQIQCSERHQVPALPQTSQNLTVSFIKGAPIEPVCLDVDAWCAASTDSNRCVCLPVHGISAAYYGLLLLDWQGN
jgi:hypothetical protein